MPLEPFTGDESFISCFEAVVPEVLRAFAPDLIVSQNGCDAHVLDPLSHLAATTRLYEHVPRRIHDLAHELCDGRWVALGGGGYDIWRVVPRAWTALWTVVSHQGLPEKVAEEWLLKRQTESPVELPRLMRDDAAQFPPAGPRVARRRTATAARPRGCSPKFCPESVEPARGHVLVSRYVSKDAYPAAYLALTAGRSRVP